MDSFSEVVQNSVHHAWLGTPNEGLVTSMVGPWVQEVLKTGDSGVKTLWPDEEQS